MFLFLLIRNPHTLKQVPVKNPQSSVSGQKQEQRHGLLEHVVSERVCVCVCVCVCGGGGVDLETALPEESAAL